MTKETILKLLDSPVYEDFLLGLELMNGKNIYETIEFLELEQSIVEQPTVLRNFNSRWRDRQPGKIYATYYLSKSDLTYFCGTFLFLQNGHRWDNSIII